MSTVVKWNRMLDYGRPSERAERLPAGAEFGWTMLGWVGLLLSAVGGQDVLLAVLPLHLGDPQWEFGTMTSVLNGLPVLTLGLALILGWGAAMRRQWMLRVTGIVLLVLATAVLVGLTMYALTVPLALKATTEPALHLGLTKAIAKTSVQAVLYPLAYVAMGIAAIRFNPKSSAQE